MTDHAKGEVVWVLDHSEDQAVLLAVGELALRSDLTMFRWDGEQWVQVPRAGVDD